VLTGESYAIGRVRPSICFFSIFWNSWPLTLISASVWDSSTRWELKVTVVGQGRGLGSGLKLARMITRSFRRPNPVCLLVSYCTDYSGCKLMHFVLFFKKITFHLIPGVIPLIFVALLCSSLSSKTSLVATTRATQRAGNLPNDVTGMPKIQAYPNDVTGTPKWRHATDAKLDKSTDNRIFRQAFVTWSSVRDSVFKSIVFRCREAGQTEANRNYRRLWVLHLVFCAHIASTSSVHVIKK